MDSSRFYHDLKSFSDFREITADSHFATIPADWWVYITDVKGSTQAIESGRYKDVNTIGAASIAVVRNVLEEDFPYVFGGDGATMLVPPQKRDAVDATLGNLQRLATEQFGLALRTGRISVAETRDSGNPIEVAKHELATGKCIAVFRGGGLTHAEKMIKTGGEKYQCPALPPGFVELKGLSCRWKNIPNKRGRVLSLLVVAQGQNTDRTYQDILDFLNGLYDGDINHANPVNTELMTYKTAGECVTDEKRYTTSRWSPGYLYRLYEILAAVLLFKHKVPNPLFDTAHYKASMRTHSDYRKFDDMLRMTIDCSEKQAARIRDFLDGLHRGGAICFGLHESEESLMTCFVQDIKDGHHIHFIDGGSGGYAVAAKQLKQQLRRNTTKTID